jgi:hypothetical protein
MAAICFRLLPWCFRQLYGRQERDRSGQVARLTKRAVEAAEVRASEYFIWCDELPGFGVRIYPSGRRGYLVQYRSSGRSRRANIGLHGRLTADEARKEAMALLGQVAKGGDPAEERATRRASLTVRELCERYLAAAEKGGILSFAISEGVIPSNPAQGVRRLADGTRTARLTPATYRQLGRALEEAGAEGENPAALGCI